MRDGIGEDVQAHCEQSDHHSRHHYRPRIERESFAVLGDHQGPIGRRRGNAEAEEGLAILTAALRAVSAQAVQAGK